MTFVAALQLQTALQRQQDLAALAMRGTQPKPRFPVLDIYREAVERAHMGAAPRRVGMLPELGADFGGPNYLDTRRYAK